MSFQLTLPEPETRVTIETDLMKEVARRTVDAHAGSPLVVWSGESRVGKSHTAQWLCRKIEEASEREPDRGFVAVHYEVGAIGNSQFSLTSRADAGDMKRAVRSLYVEAVGKISETVYRRATQEELAKMLVAGLRAKNIQMVFVDEAGLLSVDAVRGMVLVRDVAENMGWTLSLVFIGMDDIGETMVALPQVKNRVHTWCCFKPYDLEETHKLLCALHPHFAGLSMKKPEDRAQVEYIHDKFEGLPGNIVPFVRMLRSSPHANPVTLAVIKALALIGERDEAQIRNPQAQNTTGRRRKDEIASKSARDNIG
jgi:hypothetical protein